MLSAANASRLIRRSVVVFGVAAILLNWLVVSICGGDDESKNGGDKAARKRLTFEEDIVPILKSHCLKCHGPKMRKAGLDLRRRFSIVKGGDGGKAIVPGKPGESLLIEMLVGGDMPPEGEDRLAAKQIEIIRRWIAAGALTKDEKEPPLDADDVESTVSDEDRKFWAFQPPIRPRVPNVQGLDRVRNPIDAFLLAKLEAAGAGFNLDATAEVLIRRAFFDLHGLPPSPVEIDAFLADDRPDAYERLIDRLLASPRYGERWGRHWLDVAGYADSDGYLAADRIRPEAWRYRDYVIRAYNDDKPYNRFLTEQIAGDELADWRRADELTPELIDNLIATGFLRTASDPTYGNYAQKLECYKVMADTMQIFSSALLGLTLQCARCHEHKYDPISQRDYYKLHAVFKASYDPDRWLVSIERAIPLATDADAAKIAKINQQIAARVKQLDALIAELNKSHRQKFLDEKLTGVTDLAVRKKVTTALLTDVKKRSNEQKKLIAKHAPKITVTEPELFARFPEYKTELGQLRAAVKAENTLKKSSVPLRGLIDLDDKPRPTRLLRRGDFNKPGRIVEPGVPEVLSPAGYQFQSTPGYKTSGRRLALARWLVDPKHPLTARVHVNRIWAHHFSRGIVTSVDNFGKTGVRPSHPALLDWLATEFISRGWSSKALHRLIMTSTAYRQSSHPNRKQQAADPGNVLLGAWRPRRHEGEVIRDSVLSAAGKLNSTMFGRPVPVARQKDGLVTVADTPNGNRRSVYLIVRRNTPLTLLELFDTPRMEVNCTARTQSIVVTQSLSMLNSAFIESNAKALAERVLREPASDDRVRIERIFRLLAGRLPVESELRSMTEFLAAMVEAILGEKTSSASESQRQSAHAAAWTQLALVLLNSNEFVFVH